MREELVCTLRQIKTPSGLEREKLDASKYKELSLEELERLKLEKIIRILEDPSFTELVGQGFVTLAMIKPAEPNFPGLSDTEAALAVKASIQPPLETILDLSLVFDEKTINEFYDGEPKRSQQQAKPHTHKDRFQNRWEEFVDLMISGPTTVLLLWSKEGDAVSLWRAQMGHWNVEERRDFRTIRGRFAPSNYNGITHGSDSIEAVRREIGILSAHLKPLLGVDFSVDCLPS